MLANLFLHRLKLLMVLLVACSSMLAGLLFGVQKGWNEIDWIDVIGEGGASIALACWFVLILGSRPSGRVTNWLSMGLAFLFLALWQDTLDEFIRFPGTAWWDQWLESILMPIGLAVLTCGLYFWHQEQLILNRHLHKREQRLRQHKLSDDVLYIGRADYLREHIEAQTAAQQPFSLLMFEVGGMQDWLRRYGAYEANRLLRDTTDLLLINLRQQDLVCRYASSRFAILLPNTNNKDACLMAWQLQQSFEHTCFRDTQGQPLQQAVLWFVATHSHHDQGDIIQQANDGLNAQRLQSAA